MEGEKVVSSLPEKADYASLSPSDSAFLYSPLTAPVATFKIEDNPFSPVTYPVDEEMCPSLPSPQGFVPTTVAPPLPQGHILVDGIYYQPVPAPHNVVVAQSMVPPPSMVPVAPTEAPALSTPNSIAPTDSDVESIVLVESSETPEPMAGTQTGSPATPLPTTNSEPKVGLEFAMPKTLPPRLTKRLRMAEDHDCGRGHHLPTIPIVASAKGVCFNSKRSECFRCSYSKKRPRKR